MLHSIHVPYRRFKPLTWCFDQPANVCQFHLSIMSARQEIIVFLFVFQKEILTAYPSSIFQVWHHSINREYLNWHNKTHYITKKRVEMVSKFYKDVATPLV